MNLMSGFYTSVGLAFMSLFPPVNPIGTALIIDPYLQSLSSHRRRNASAKIALYSFLVCVFSTFIGTAIFQVFGISIPAVQIAGGLLICRMGYDVLHAETATDESGKALRTDPEKSWNNLQTNLFYPLSFPMTTGAGTISVILTLTADNYDPMSAQHIFNQMGLVTGSFLICFCVFVSYNYAPFILSHLGKRGQVILNRLSGFLTLCVGIQILINGIFGAIKQMQ